jgi:hypothetical protein
VAEPAKPEYVPLDRSPLAVRERTRTARYWYSGGKRLDQGPTSASVAFAWTQWLNDRGFGETFDQAYAQALYAESQKIAGIEGPTSGSYVWAADQALRQRGLVETSYACPTVTLLVDALLERGPVVASVSWHQSMGEPVWVAGRAVVQPEGQVTGGHAVVLNGVDLELELNGARGFVRLKNSWGPTWADDGHALVSLADLETLLGEDTLLPIPASEPLRPGSAQDVADPESAPGGYAPQSIGSDLWTTHDTIGYASYAEAIARGIQHDETAPPLTIGIKAPWGAGKTSLMRMIRDRLEWPDGRRAPVPRRLHLVGRASDAAVTNRTLLENANRDAEPMPGMRAAPDAEHEDERRWRPTVWFNPWMYQTGEQVWAGLAHEIITQVTERMPRVERERFWLELNLRRIDEQAIRRRIYALVLERLVPWALGAAVLLVAGLALLAIDTVVGAGVIAAGPAALAIAAAAQLRSVLGARPSGALAKLVTPATEQLVRSPDYGSQTGFFYLLHADLQQVLDLVATPRRPLVVFVDDLDRCAPGTVVQVIEAINLFLAGQYPNCIFVIAMEPDMVAAHVEAAYGSLVQRFEAQGGAFDLGWRFLEKIVQLPLTLPALGSDRAAALAESLFGAAEEEPPPEEEEEGEVAAIAERLDEGALSSAVALAGSVAPRGEAAEAVRRSVSRRLSIDDPEVRAVITYGTIYLDANPREIKRFINVFRFLVMIHTERSIEGVATATSLEGLAKLALVSTRWPSLMSTLAEPIGFVDGSTVFEVLETTDDADSLRAALVEGGLAAPVAARLFDQTLAKLLRAQPTVGSAARHYL